MDLSALVCLDNIQFPVQELRESKRGCWGKGCATTSAAKRAKKRAKKVALEVPEEIKIPNLFTAATEPGEESNNVQEPAEMIVTPCEEESSTCT
jgi:hypothetical protein